MGQSSVLRKWRVGIASLSPSPILPPRDTTLRRVAQQHLVLASDIRTKRRRPLRKDGAQLRSRRLGIGRLIFNDILDRGGTAGGAGAGAGAAGVQLDGVKDKLAVNLERRWVGGFRWVGRVCSLDRGRGV